MLRYFIDNSYQQLTDDKLNCDMLNILVLLCLIVCFLKIVFLDQLKFASNLTDNSTDNSPINDLHITH